MSNINIGYTSNSYNVFADCYNLRLVEINNTESIGSYCFENCQLLETVTINGITDIKSDAFKDCQNLTTLEITMNNTNDTTQIREEIINGCTSLTSITINKPENTSLTIDQFALSHSVLTDIYVSWAEGEVANAPWILNPTGVTVHYSDKDVVYP